MRFGVLGSLTVWTDAGTVVPISGAKVRALLAVLLVHAGAPVTADRLLDDIWGEELPGNAAGTLSAKASQLRRALRDAEPGAQELVVSPPPGYRLASARVDALEFAALLADGATASVDVSERIKTLTAALALWRGPALSDFRDHAFAQPVITRLEEQRLLAVEELAELRLSQGAHAAVASELAGLVAEHPLRERLRAAHLRALYGAGRQSEALDSYEQFRAALADELGLDPGPELVELQRAILAQDLAAPAPAIRRRTSNVPAPLADLVGRDDDIERAVAALAHTRLVSLVGPGGVGKTRLATAVANAARARDGVWFVELAPVTHRIADTVLTTLDIRTGAGESDDPLDALCAAVADRELLIVLDNCEHVVDEAAAVAERLLSAGTGVQVLTTSREPLRLPGEDVQLVDPLPLPDAVTLFLRRAPRDFVLDAGTRGPVETLCRRLDGIPLALELAATRVRALGIDGLVARLDDRFRLLATGHRGAPPRQQTLMAMIDWSWGLLSAPEQTVLRRLAVHSDGCTLAAAEAVCALPDVDVVDVVLALVDRSLVVATAPRYRLLESVAAYCLRQLGDEASEIRRRHHEYYLDLAERARPHLYGADQKQWLRLLDDETANLRTAFDNLVADDNGPGAVRLAKALSWYWYLRGRLAEAVRCLDAALALHDDRMAQAWRLGFGLLKGDFGNAAHRRAAVFDGFDDPMAQWFVGFSGMETGELDAHVALLERAHEQFSAAGDDWGVGAVNIALAKNAHSHADPDELRRYAEAGARAFARTGDRWGHLQADAWLGGLAELTGDLDEAHRLQLAGLQAAQELELWLDASGQLSWLGWIAMQSGRYDDARNYSDQAIAIAPEQGSGPGTIFAQIVRAFAERRDGNYAAAEAILGPIIEFAGADPDQTPLFLPMLELEVGHIRLAEGNVPAARDLFEKALNGAKQIAAPRDTAFTLEALAAVAVETSDYADATRLLDEAAAIRVESRMPRLPAEQAAIDVLVARIPTD